MFKFKGFTGIITKINTSQMKNMVIGNWQYKNNPMECRIRPIHKPSPCQSLVISAKKVLTISMLRLDFVCEL